jgi:GT2 family glycosyltransferase/glycosyltransferase involved in cell wall biosynthesis
LPGEHDFDLYGDTLQGETLAQSYGAVRELAERLGIRDAILLVQYPSWEPLARALADSLGWRLVYDCMDEHTGFGTHGAQTAAEEERLIREADLVLVTSRLLEERIGRSRPDALRLPNAGEERHFARLPVRDATSLGKLPRPVIGYYGAISTWFDVAAVRAAAQRHPDWSFALLGDTRGAQLDDLQRMSNVYTPGEVPYADLPAHVAAFDVCTIPFLRTPLTEATNPVKIFEYFATGKPVVARRLPELEAFGHVIAMYETPEEFVTALERAVKESVASGPAAEQRRALARQNTWQVRYQTLRARLEATPVRPRRDAAIAASSGESDALERRKREIRRLAAVIRERDEGIAFLHGEVAERENLIAHGKRVHAERERILTEQRETLEREKNARIRDLETALEDSRTLAEARGEHLRTALGELSRWENSKLGRLRRGLSALRSPRKALGRATAPGTPLFALGQKALPGPLAKFLRRNFAPVEQPEKMVRLPPQPPAIRARAQDSVPPAPSGRYDAIVFSIIDWDFRFQRPQQLGTQFGRHGHRVFYLSTTQFLAPGGPAWDLTRKAENVGELRIRSRRPLDIYRGRLDAEDVEALTDSFENLARDLAIGDAVGLVQIPFWAPIAERLRDRLGWRVVYDCMDEWTNFPGFGPDVLAIEEGLVRRADVTVVSADRLLEKWKDTAPRLTLAKNGIDAEHYRRYYGPNDLLAGAKRPIIGYYGALASWVDAPLLSKIADAHPDATLVLAGGHFDVDLSGISKRPNVRLLGQRPYEEMPKLLYDFDVCMIPFLVNDITEATNPVKFYEYLYGGKGVVAPALTELLPYAELSYLARGGNHQEFLDQLDRALAEPKDDPRREARRKVAEENDWAHRYAAIDEGVAAAHPLVSVVVVTYGGLDLTKACLESLRGETWPRLEILVVDNASSDGTPEFLRQAAARDPRMRTIFNAENRGFAAANNQGIAASRGDIVVLLNNDTVVPPGLMGGLVRHLERDPSIGLLCPTTNFCGNEARVEPDYQDIRGLPAYAARRASEHRGNVFDIGVAAMYCVAARRAVLDEVGPLDEAYGIGMFEDDDFAVRMREKGFRVACAEDVYVHHVGQGAFRKLSPEAYDALWKKNQAYFEKKFGVAWSKHTPREGVAAVESKVGL